ncbi:MAG: hypothetical protein RJA36_2645 [Pseudomonadota bacterium]
MSHEEIAIGMGLARNTLEKHFAAELSAGAYAKRLEILQAMHAAAKKGNMTAARAYLANEPRVAAPPLPQSEAEPRKQEPLGKKAQANADATTAAVGTEWDTLLKAQAAPLQ